jgi:hypothetical protein
LTAWYGDDVLPTMHASAAAQRLGGILRRLRRGVGPGDVERHIREASASESFPYLVEYDVPLGFAFPPGFACGDFRGLRFCEVLAAAPPGTAAAKVVAFWRDRESFEHQAATFASALGGPPLIWQGYQHRVQTREKPKWWRNTAGVYLLAVHAVAVIGTGEALRTHYAELFAPGDVHVYAKDAQYDVLDGQPFRFIYKVRNIGTAKTALSLAVPRVRRVGDAEASRPAGGPPECAGAPASTLVPPTPGSGLTLGDDVRAVPDITVGEIEDISVSGVARGAGRYCLAVDGQVESGVLRRLILGDSQFRTDLSVRVWSPIGYDLRLARVDRDRCWYRILLSSGVAFPDGVRMSADLPGVPGAAFGFVQGVADARQPRTVSTPGAEVSGLDWLTHPLEARRDTVLTLDVRAPAASEPACLEIGEKIKLRHFGAKEFSR